MTYTRLAPLLLACAAIASGDDAASVTSASPSGEWSLTVTHLDEAHNGAVELVLTKSAAEVWHRQQHLGVRRALVDDAGRVAGFGYTGENMPESGSVRPSRGRTLHVFVLRSDGEVAIDETHERGMPLYPDGPCNPDVVDAFLHPELGRYVVRVADEDLNRGAEQWWGYDLATGAVLFRERPKQKLAVAEALRGITSAHPVPGTPLVLVHWNHFDSTHVTVSAGAVFQLVDADWNVVWSFDAVKERKRDRDRIAEGGLGAMFGEQSFELPTATAGERARFEVRSENGTWKIVEVERKRVFGGTSAR